MDVRKRTDRHRREWQHHEMMHLTPSASNGPANGTIGFPDQAAVPTDVFYIVQSKGDGGERDHRLHSALYETHAGAETELSRLQAADEPGAGSYEIWRSTTYIDPAEWLHRVVRSDGTLILPRLRGAEKCAATSAGAAAGQAG